MPRVNVDRLYQQKEGSAYLENNGKYFSLVFSFIFQ